ncbi:MAG: hypothetical protein V4757_23170 [Pseudomonadota bacterium]
MSYSEKLQRTIIEWKQEPIGDEWLFDRFRRDCIISMTPEEAFDAIDETVEVLVGETDSSTIVELTQCLITLARQSQTTQTPRSISENRNVMKLLVLEKDNYVTEKMQELLRYYRLT